MAKKKDKEQKFKLKKALEDYEKKVNFISPSKVKATLPSYDATKAIKSIAESTNSQLVSGDNRFKRTGYFTDEFVEQRTKDIRWLGSD
jgi:hypothetical protein